MEIPSFRFFPPSKERYHLTSNEEINVTDVSASKTNVVRKQIAPASLFSEGENLRSGYHGVFIHSTKSTTLFILKETENIKVEKTLLELHLNIGDIHGGCTIIRKIEFSYGFGMICCDLNKFLLSIGWITRNTFLTENHIETINKSKKVETLVASFLPNYDIKTLQVGTTSLGIFINHNCGCNIYLHHLENIMTWKVHFDCEVFFSKNFDEILDFITLQLRKFSIRYLRDEVNAIYDSFEELGRVSSLERERDCFNDESEALPHLILRAVVLEQTLAILRKIISQVENFSRY